jgi:hypothetical protein
MENSAQLNDEEKAMSDSLDAMINSAKANTVPFGNSEAAQNPLQDLQTSNSIQGTRHRLSCADGKIRIGCYETTFEDWQKNFEEIGKANNYTDSEIAEYKSYVDLAIELNSSNVGPVI